MKFVIVGFGRVGMRTARTLWDEGHEVVVIERDRERADRAKNEDFAVIEGDGSDEQVLDQAGLEDTDAIAGLTSDINANFSACVVGEAHGCRTVLRVDEEFSGDLYEKYTGDVDEVIYPERLGAAGAKTALLGGDFNVIADITKGLSVASVEIPDGSPVIGTRVIEVDLPGEARIYAHGRADESMTIPLPQTAIEAGDSVAVMANPEQIPEIRATLRGEQAAT
ncbi:potassium transporter Trk [Halobacteriales archaeon QH_10_65_19]|jgi:trk system potassium uptake protein TrkA|nr:MAG: potassium transporter Trk [Halobacteriales archaeon QH_10_65_19]